MKPVESKRAKIPLPTATCGCAQPTLAATPRDGKGGYSAALPPRGALSMISELVRKTAERQGVSMLRNATRAGDDRRSSGSMRCFDPNDLPMSDERLVWARELRCAIVEDVIHSVR